jgi:hypothetical protein
MTGLPFMPILVWRILPENEDGVWCPGVERAVVSPLLGGADMASRVFRTWQFESRETDDDKERRSESCVEWD